MSPLSKGLRNLSIPRLLFFVSALSAFLVDVAGISLIPFIVLLAVTVLSIYTAVIWEIFSLRKLSRAEAGYRTAFQLAMGIAATCVLEFVVTVIWQDAQEECLILFKLAGFLLVCFEILTTVRLLKECGSRRTAVSGMIILAVFAVSYVASPVMELLDLFIPDVSDTGAAQAALFVLRILSVITDLMYFVFLRIAAGRLQDIPEQSA